MIGLTYIRKLNNMSMQELAQRMGVGKQAVSQWENKQIKISNKRITQLSEIFNIPEKYFPKEINSKDEIEIQNLKLKNEIETIEYEDTILNDDGTSYIVLRKDLNGEFYEIELNNAKINKIEALEKIKQSFEIKEDVGIGEDIYKINQISEVYSKIADIISSNLISIDKFKKFISGIAEYYGIEKVVGKRKSIEDIIKLLEK